jgi:undecaprenyl-diphosphatase
MQSPIVALDVVMPFDRTLFRDVNELARGSGWLHAPVLAYASYGVVLFAGLLLVGWWVARVSCDHRRVAVALWTPLGALAALALNQPLVNAVREPRPYEVLPHLLVLTHRSADYSFPSDHAVMAGAVAAGLFLVDRRLGVVAGLAALLMAFSRVYVGAHWPGDVVVGLVLGGAVTVLGFTLLERPLTAAVDLLVRTPPPAAAGCPIRRRCHIAG